MSWWSTTDCSYIVWVHQELHQIIRRCACHVDRDGAGRVERTLRWGVASSLATDRSWCLTLWSWQTSRSWWWWCLRQLKLMCEAVLWDVVTTLELCVGTWQTTMCYIQTTPSKLFTERSRLELITNGSFLKLMTINSGVIECRQNVIPCLWLGRHGVLNTAKWSASQHKVYVLM